MTLYHVRLELARSKEFPNGSAMHGYEFIAPLDAGGHLNSDEWKKDKAKCTVRRFTAGQPDETGFWSMSGAAGISITTRAIAMTTSRSTNSTGTRSSRASICPSPNTTA